MKAVLTPTVANATLNLNQDGSATLLISTVDMGQGSDTIMRRSPARCSASTPPDPGVRADTDVTPYDTITAGSRSTYHTGNAVRRVAEGMRERLLALAAEQLGRAGRGPRARPPAACARDRDRHRARVVHAKYGARGATHSPRSNFTTGWQPYDKETGLSEKVTEHWFAGAAAVRIARGHLTGRIRPSTSRSPGTSARRSTPRWWSSSLPGRRSWGAAMRCSTSWSSTRVR